MCWAGQSCSSTDRRASIFLHLWASPSLSFSSQLLSSQPRGSLWWLAAHHCKFTAHISFISAKVRWGKNYLNWQEHAHVSKTRSRGFLSLSELIQTTPMLESWSWCGHSPANSKLADSDANGNRATEHALVSKIHARPLPVSSPYSYQCISCSQSFKAELQTCLSRMAYEEMLCCICPPFSSFLCFVLLL